jgi:hypothetical protein
MERSGSVWNWLTIFIYILATTNYPSYRRSGMSALKQYWPAVTCWPDALLVVYFISEQCSDAAGFQLHSSTSGDEMIWQQCYILPLGWGLLPHMRAGPGVIKQLLHYSTEIQKRRTLPPHMALQNYHQTCFFSAGPTIHLSSIKMVLVNK